MWMSRLIKTRDLYLDPVHTNAFSLEIAYISMSLDLLSTLTRWTFSAKPHRFKNAPNESTCVSSSCGHSKTHRNKKRLSHPYNVSDSQASRPCEIIYGVSFEHVCIVKLMSQAQFSVFERLSVNSWKRYENGSVDAHRSMRFRYHQKGSQMKTHWCFQGLRRRTLCQSIPHISYSMFSKLCCPVYLLIHHQTNQWLFIFSCRYLLFSAKPH